jgi:hypothetical protein
VQAASGSEVERYRIRLRVGAPIHRRTLGFDAAPVHRSVLEGEEIEEGSKLRHDGSACLTGRGHDPCRQDRFTGPPRASGNSSKRTSVPPYFAAGLETDWTRSVGVRHPAPIRTIDEERPQMPELYPWWVFLHVFGAFAFAFAHGTSMMVAFRIRQTRDLAQIRALLDVSGMATGVMYVGLLLLLIGGIAAGIVGNHFGRGWIWAAIVLLVLTMVAMYMLATPFYQRLRVAVGADLRDPRVAEGQPALAPADLEAIVASNRPMVLAAIGLAGFVVILWLMLFKPF